MTAKPASVTKRHGHLHLGRYSVRREYATSYYRFRVILENRGSVSEYALGKGCNGCKTFFGSGEKIYYMDGNYGIWKTDIVNMSDVVFNPVCTEKGRIVNFLKLHKLEWLFA